jgi:hypothetical protein
MGQPQPSRSQEAVNRISGTYKTTRDAGLDYSYVVTWENTPIGLAWSAKVSRNGMPAGSPSALVGVAGGFDPVPYLHRMIALYIESRWQVE